MSTVKERPILFNGEMVRAILDGSKTQTRSFVPEWQLPKKTADDGRYMSIAQNHPRWGFGVFGNTEESCMANYNPEYRALCPYGRIGEHLWVRETFQSFETCPPSGIKEVVYRSDGKGYGEFSCDEIIWRPSIHMPRWASRITLEITSVRVERLQDISEEDAKAEGVECLGPKENVWQRSNGEKRHWRERGFLSDAECLFADLWKSINGPESWDANPWVWVIEFKRID